MGSCPLYAIANGRKGFAETKVRRWRGVPLGKPLVINKVNDFNFGLIRLYQRRSFGEIASFPQGILKNILKLLLFQFS